MKSIHYILLITLLVRLYHINFPVSGWHSWRQADTASIARNFFETGNSIFYPQIDWRGNTEGYVESEFQAYPYIISLLYRIFGENDLIGRIVSVFFSILSVLGLYLLTRKIINEKTAVWASLIYAILPLNVYFTRAFMPESALLMCSIYGIYFFYEWTQKDKLKYFFAALFFISLSVLIKLPTLYIGLPLAYLTYRKFGRKMLLQWKIILFTLFVLSITALWYYHARNLYYQTGLTFSIWNFGKDKWGMTDVLFSLKFYNDIFLKSIAERHLTYAGFILFIWGLFIKREKPLERVFDFYLISFLIFIFIAPQAHLAQEYYQLPFNIFASVFAAKVTAKYINLKNFREMFSKNRLAVTIILLCLLFIPILSFLRFANFMKSEKTDAPIFRLTGEVKKHIEKYDLIITVSDGNPVYLYLSERKGWAVFSSEVSDNYIAELRLKGAKYIIGESSVFKNDNRKINVLKTNYNEIILNDEYFIFRLE